MDRRYVVLDQEFYLRIYQFKSGLEQYSVAVVLRLRDDIRMRPIEFLELFSPPFVYLRGQNKIRISFSNNLSQPVRVTIFYQHVGKQEADFRLVCRVFTLLYLF